MTPRKKSWATGAIDAAREMLNPEIMAITVAHIRLKAAGAGAGAVILLPPNVAEGFTVIADMPVIRVPELARPMLGLPAGGLGDIARPGS